MNNNTLTMSIKAEIHKDIMEYKAEHKKDEDLEWKVKMIRANIPKEFWHAELSNFKGDSEVLKKVKIYCKRLRTVKKHGFGFIFMGSHGTGKTTLQMIILKNVIRKGYNAFYMTLSEMFHYIYMGYEYKPLLQELYGLVKQTTFLALGEVGKDYHRKGSELFVQSTFDDIFRYRRSRCLPTSIDTNMDEQELEGTYGEGLISLFSSRNKMMRVRGRDFRKVLQRKDWKKHL